MFYGSNLHRKDNPGWLPGDGTQAPRVLAGRARFACGVCVAWCIGVPRRAGARLHAADDVESRWWHWLVTERHGGFTHQYRDARFETLRRDPTSAVPG